MPQVTVSYIVGLDLGQPHEFSALAVVEKQPVCTTEAHTVAAWREGKHDDLVRAVAIAVWQAKRQIEYWRAFGPTVFEPRRCRR